jgi:hypothetical protein
MTGIKRDTFDFLFIPLSLPLPEKRAQKAYYAKYHLYFNIKAKESLAQSWLKIGQYSLILQSKIFAKVLFVHIVQPSPLILCIMPKCLK